MDRVEGELIDHGVVFKGKDCGWVDKQMWAPDCAMGRDGKFYLYFPARDKKGELMGCWKAICSFVRSLSSYPAQLHWFHDLHYFNFTIAFITRKAFSRYAHIRR